MKAVFADTFYFIALVNPNDKAHQWAADYSRESRVQLVTTTWVLAEVGNYLCATQTRPVLKGIVESLRNDPDQLLLPPDEAIFFKGIELYDSRPDKEWSLTDCVSFLVMEERNIHEALTGDRHFAQAGFEILFKA